MKKCWNLLLALSMLLTACMWSLPVSAEEPAPGTNLLKGGYGWVGDPGWGQGKGELVDGNMTTSERATRNKEGGSYMAAAMPAALGVQKFNKVRLFFHKAADFSPASYYMNTYTGAGTADPGESCLYKNNTAVSGGDWSFLRVAGSQLEGTRENLFTYNSATDGALPQQMVYEFTEPVEGRIFYFYYVFPAVTANTTFGLYEMEAYYVTPVDVSWDDGEVAISKPTAAAPYEAELPAYSVYDQLGDKMGDNLKAAFPATLELKENYPGVTLEDGKLSVTSECTAETIELNYTAVDSEGITVLEKTLSITVADDTKAAELYLRNQIPAQTKTNLTLPESYTEGGKNISISWTSGNENYIKADGTVTRPQKGASDETVTLTATLTAENGTEKQVTFDVKVLAKLHQSRWNRYTSPKGCIR